MMSARAPVSVIVPFFGGAADAEATCSALGSIRVRPDDELIVVDNTVEGRFAALPPGSLTVVRATAEQSSYHARNVGAEKATAQWLIFTDSDCRPTESWIDDLFAEPIPSDCGIIAGAVASAPGQDALVARYARSRGHVNYPQVRSRSGHVESFARPAGVTANLLVRRSAWAAVGGFHEGVRSGGDVEFCWRAQDAGWGLEVRERALVLHVQPARLRPMLRKAARWSAGRAWVNRRYRGLSPRPKLARPLARCAAGIVVWTATGRLERALFKAIDGLMVGAACAGYCLGNSPRGRTSPRPAESDAGRTGRLPSVTIFTEAFPALSETFVVNEVRALREAGHRVRVEASIRPARPEREALRDLDVSYFEDDSIARKVLTLPWFLGRHPIACLRDSIDRRRWTRGEVWPLNSLGPPARRLARAGTDHLHAHFAAAAALNALRLGALLGIPYSLATHGYDIFKSPRNLEDKHRRAAFAVSDCDYSVDYIRERIDGPDGARLHKLVLGVNGERFRRSRPYPGGRAVLAVARLVEKKGLSYLLEAAVALNRRGAIDRVRIVGGGPLRDELEQQRRDLDLEEVVELLGPREPDEVKDLLETADILAMPCVVASDGDRDTMPVVVKEALAMEVPVVASDEVGLPELVRPEWGRLVPPRNAEALAEAIAELLALPRDRRVDMGRAGRAWVLEHCNLNRETERLRRLIAEVSARGRPGRRTYSEARESGREFTV